MNIQKKSQEFFGQACYAYCIAYLIYQTKDWFTLTLEVLSAARMHYIEDDGYVSKPQKFYGCNDVQEVAIKSLKDLPEGEWAVEWQLNGKSHFVVCNKGGVVFDPWENSETVKKGKPVSYRRFI